jgi:uncharacterized protein YbjT (DUF2867 family)
MDVLVLGATGRYAPLVPLLAREGHRVRAATRDPAHAPYLHQAAVEVARVDLDDRASIAAAARGVDAVFFGGTAHRAGPGADVAHGRNVVDAARAAGVEHVVYVSVAGADRPSEVPLFESKRQVEAHLRGSGVPSTIVAPVCFMENLWNPWNMPLLARGRFPSPIRAGRTLQQIALEDVLRFATYALTHPGELLRERVEVAADELDALEAASIVGQLTGRTLEVDAKPVGGPQPLFAWLDEVGYSVDIDSLRGRFPAIGWCRFRDWAAGQDWSRIDSARM